MGNLIPQDDAARMLGMSEEDLLTERRNNEIFGYRDGDIWKFKMQEIERYANDKQIRIEGITSDSREQIQTALGENEFTLEEAADMLGMTVDRLSSEEIAGNISSGFTLENSVGTFFELSEIERYANENSIQIKDITSDSRESMQSALDDSIGHLELEEEYFKPEVAARMLGLTVADLEAAEGDNEIEGVYIGDELEWVFAMEEIERFAKENSIELQSGTPQEENFTLTPGNKSDNDEQDDSQDVGQGLDASGSVEPVSHSDQPSHHASELLQASDVNFSDSNITPLGDSEIYEEDEEDELQDSEEFEEDETRQVTTPPETQLINVERLQQLDQVLLDVEICQLLFVKREDLNQLAQRAGVKLMDAGNGVAATMQDVLAMQRVINDMRSQETNLQFYRRDFNQPLNNPHEQFLHFYSNQWVNIRLLYSTSEAAILMCGNSSVVVERDDVLVAMQHGLLPYIEVNGEPLVNLRHLAHFGHDIWNAKLDLQKAAELSKQHPPHYQAPRNQPTSAPTRTATATAQDAISKLELQNSKADEVRAQLESVDDRDGYEIKNAVNRYNNLQAAASEMFTKNDSLGWRNAMYEFDSTLRLYETYIDPNRGGKIDTQLEYEVIFDRLHAMAAFLDVLIANVQVVPNPLLNMAADSVIGTPTDEKVRNQLNEFERILNKHLTKINKLIVTMSQQVGVPDHIKEKVVATMSQRRGQSQPAPVQPVPESSVNQREPEPLIDSGESPDSNSPPQASDFAEVGTRQNPGRDSQTEDNDDQSEEGGRRLRPNWVKRIGLTVAALVLTSAMTSGISKFMSGKWNPFASKKGKDTSGQVETDGDKKEEKKDSTEGDDSTAETFIVPQSPEQSLPPITRPPTGKMLMRYQDSYATLTKGENGNTITIALPADMVVDFNNNRARLSYVDVAGNTKTYYVDATKTTRDKFGNLQVAIPGLIDLESTTVDLEMQSTSGVWESQNLNLGLRLRTSDKPRHTRVADTLNTDREFDVEMISAEREGKVANGVSITLPEDAGIMYQNHQLQVEVITDQGDREVIDINGVAPVRTSDSTFNLRIFPKRAASSYTVQVNSYDGKRWWKVAERNTETETTREAVRLDEANLTEVRKSEVSFYRDNDDGKTKVQIIVTPRVHDLIQKGQIRMYGTDLDEELDDDDLPTIIPFDVRNVRLGTVDAGTGEAGARKEVYFAQYDMPNTRYEINLWYRPLRNRSTGNDRISTTYTLDKLPEPPKDEAVKGDDK